MGPKVDNKKSAKSSIPSGIPSAGISSTKSGKERILTDYYQNYSKKTGSRSTESSKGAAASPPSTPSPFKSESPNKSQKNPEPGTQNPSSPATGAQTSPPPQDGDVLAPSHGEVTASEDAMNDDLPPSLESSVMALLDSDDNQGPAPVFDLDLEP